MDKINVWILKHSSPFGSRGHHKMAFTEKATAQTKAKQLSRQFHSYKPVMELAELLSGEKLDGDRVIHDMKVYNLNRSSGYEALRRHALSKLSKKDIEVLELSHLIENHQASEE